MSIAIRKGLYEEMKTGLEQDSEGNRIFRASGGGGTLGMRFH